MRLAESIAFLELIRFLVIVLLFLLNICYSLVPAFAAAQFVMLVLISIFNNISIYSNSCSFASAISCTAGLADAFII